MALNARQTHVRLLPSLVLCTAALTLLAGSSAAFTFTFTFTTIDVPGAILTEARGINPQGQIVGAYGVTDAACTSAQGFLLDQGVFTTLNHPAAGDTILTGITRSGKIVGSYNAAGTRGCPDGFSLPRGVLAWLWPPLPQQPGSTHGFLLVRGAFTTIDVPGAHATVPSDIGRHGQIVGWYIDTSGVGHGFLLEEGVFTPIDVPGATDTFASGINGHGHVVGIYRDPSGVRHGFLRAANGTFTPIDVPGATESFALSINRRGQIVGIYRVGTPSTHGFLLDGGNFTTIDVPGAVDTILWKINGSQIVGEYLDTNSRTHGFVATP